MAYADGTLINIAGHENGTFGRIWQYDNNTDNVATIAASGFFNDATNILRHDDVIWIFGANGTGVAQVTSATAAATVTVGALSALS
jgi:hypothetical protein